MSAGDHHTHRLLGEREYDRALDDPRFQAVLARGFAVSYDYDIPYLGGYSLDGATVYIDRDTPDEWRRAGRVYPLRPRGLVSSILVHEHWEKTALAAWGCSYADAHALATHAEHLYVRDVLRLNADDYENISHPIIRAAEKKLRRSDILIPDDLDPTPYVSR